MDDELAELERMIDRLRVIRTRRCEPKANTNPSYLALSNAISQINKAIREFQLDAEPPRHGSQRLR